MEALVSGQAGLVAILGKRVQLRPIEGAPRDGGSLALVLRHLSAFSDVSQRSVKNVRDADRVLQAAWKADRALRLTLMLLDHDIDEGMSTRIVPLLNAILEDASVIDTVSKRLYAKELDEGSASRANQLLREGAGLTKLLKQVLDDQQAIGAVRGAFDALNDDLFDAEADRSRWLTSLILEGSMRDLARSISEARPVDFVALQLPGRHRALANSGAILSSWLKGFRAQKSPRRERRLEAAIDIDADWERTQGDSGNGWASASDRRRAYESAINAQAGIVDRLKHGDYTTARDYAEDLIRDQGRTSAPEHIAKSLCRLSQTAKDLEAVELQLEWAHRSTEVYPDDPMTFGHYADALISLGRYQEASLALDEAESKGSTLFAQNGRAKIIRSVGRPQEARDLYLKSAQEHAGEEGVEFALVGAAECLRDMGLPAEALSEYERLTRDWPLEPAFWHGVASSQIDLGRFNDAIRTYGRSGSSSRDSLIAISGRARVYRFAGRLTEAEASYREIITTHPASSSAHVGLGQVLRLQDRLDEAEKAFIKAQELSASNVHAVTGRAEVLRDLGEPAAAYRLVETSKSAFQHERVLHLAIANHLRWMGRYVDAAAALDGVIAQFPYYLSAELARADLLRSMGQTQHALAAYDAVLKRRPHHRAAENGKAAVLLAEGQLKAAEQLLSDRVPATEADWSAYLLRGILLSEQGSSKAAIRAFERGIARSPFARQRKLMRNALAAVLLKKRDFNAAWRSAVRMPSEAANVVYIHALAAAHRTGQARLELDGLLRGPVSAEVINLGRAVGRQFGLDGAEAEALSRDLLHREEIRALLRAA